MWHLDSARASPHRQHLPAHPASLHWCGIPNSIMIVSTTPAIYKVEKAAKFLPWWKVFLYLSGFLSSFLISVTSRHHLYQVRVHSLTQRGAVTFAFWGCTNLKRMSQYDSCKWIVCSVLNKTTMPWNEWRLKQEKLAAMLHCSSKCFY